MSSRPRPASFDVREDGSHLTLAWDDGHLSPFPAEYLRGFCPCAGCQGHGRSRWELVYQPTPGVTFEEMAPVGSYAVGFVFSDSHATGIYSFDLLRSLCPCDLCGGPGQTPPPQEWQDQGA